MKVIAYTDQNGFTTITPLQAKSAGHSELYSCHRPGERLPMYVNRKGHRHYFAYKPGFDERTGQTAPETLSHILYKQVLGELANQAGGFETHLHLTENTVRRDEALRVRFIKGQTEAPIQLNGKSYYIDVLLHFEQCDHTLLSDALRWNGQIALEVWHTHRLAASDEKCRALYDAGIPVLQVSAKPDTPYHIDETALLELDDEACQAALEAHTAKIKHYLSRAIYAVILKNPVSARYSQLQELYREYHALKEWSTEQTAQLCELQQRLEHTENQLHEQQQHNSYLLQRLTAMQLPLTAETTAAANKHKADTDTDTTRHPTLRSRIKKWLLP